MTALDRWIFLMMAVNWQPSMELVAVSADGNDCVMLSVSAHICQLVCTPFGPADRERCLWECTKCSDVWFFNTSVVAVWFVPTAYSTLHTGSAEAAATLSAIRCGNWYVLRQFCCDNLFICSLVFCHHGLYYNSHSWHCLPQPLLACQLSRKGTNEHTGKKSTTWYPCKDKVHWCLMSRVPTLLLSHSNIQKC